MEYACPWSFQSPLTTMWVSGDLATDKRVYYPRRWVRAVPRHVFIDDMTGQQGSDPNVLHKRAGDFSKICCPYVGGLANIILNNELNATSTLPTALEPVQLKINKGSISGGEFNAGVGNKAFNLSSGM